MSKTKPNAPETAYQQALEELSEALTGTDPSGDNFSQGAEIAEIASEVNGFLKLLGRYAAHPEEREALRERLRETTLTPAGRYEIAAEALEYAAVIFNFSDNFLATALTGGRESATANAGEIALLNLAGKVASEVVVTPSVVGTMIYGARRCRARAAELKGENSPESEEYKSNFQQWVDTVLDVFMGDAAIGIAGAGIALPIEERAVNSGLDPVLVSYASTAIQSAVATYTAVKFEKNHVTERLRGYVERELPLLKERLSQYQVQPVCKPAPCVGVLGFPGGPELFSDIQAMHLQRQRKAMQPNYTPFSQQTMRMPEKLYFILSN